MSDTSPATPPVEAGIDPDVSVPPEAVAPVVHPGDDAHISDRQRAFKRYKQGVAEGGKPFMPYGVYHDVIAALIVVCIIIGLSVVWFSNANCDSWFNPTCDVASTPYAQEYFPKNQTQFKKDHPEYKVGSTFWEKDSKLVVVPPGDEVPSGVKPLKGPQPEYGLTTPFFGALYESKADPATTSYHPRPEWYFYFLFYLLILFKNPQLVVVGTIGLPTIWLLLLLAWPFIDRKRERRPSRRPVAITAMVLVAVTLLSFSYLGSKAGDEGGGPEGITEAQQAMPGYQLFFDDARGKTCQNCHMLSGVGAGGPGPDLTDESTKNRGLEWQVKHLIDPKSETPGSGMPPQRTIFNDEELAHLAAFLETLGAPDRAESAEYNAVGADLVAKSTGEASDAASKPGDKADPAGDSADDTTGAGTGVS